MDFDAILKTFALTPEDARMIPVGAALFVLFWQVMARSVFAPLLKLVERREALTSGAAEQVRADLGRSREITADYEAKVAEARLGAMREKLVVLGEVKKEATQLVDRAGQRAQETLKDGRVRAAGELRALEAGVASEAEVLAGLVVERVRGGQAA